MSAPKALGVAVALAPHLRRATSGQRAPGDPLPTPYLQLLSGHLQLIQYNPISLVLHRMTRARSGAPGGSYENWRDDPEGGLGPYVCRVHQGAGRGSARVGDALTGRQERDTTWGIILPAEAQLRATDGEDGNVRVQIEHPVHGWFILRRLRALDYSGLVWGWQGDLERVSGKGPVPVPVARPKG